MQFKKTWDRCARILGLPTFQQISDLEQQHKDDWNVFEEFTEASDDRIAELVRSEKICQEQIVQLKTLLHGQLSVNSELLKKLKDCPRPRADAMEQMIEQFMFS